MKKLLLAVIVIIFLFSLTCGKRGRGKSKTNGNTYNRNTNYGGNSYNRNTNYGNSNKYGSSFKQKSSFNKVSSLLKNNKKTIRNALIAVAAYKILKSSTKLLRFPDDRYFIYFAAYELDPTFNINNNKPYTQFILPVQDTYLNCLVVPKNHIMYNTGPYSTQYERNKECSKIFRKHVRLQSTFYPPSHYNNMVTSNKTQISNTVNYDTTLCCVPTGGSIKTKYSLIIALFCMISTFTLIF